MARLLCVVLLVLGVSGCMGNGGGGVANLLPGKTTGASLQPKLKAQKKRAVLGGEITVAGPKGYCIDLSGISDTDTGAFVPLGACASISGNADDAAPKTSLFLAAAIRPIDPEASMTGADLVPAARRAMTDDAVLAALSGKENAAKIVTLRGEEQTLIAKTQHAVDHEGLGAEQWRAIFLTQGHVVALSVSGFAGQDTSKVGEKVLIAFLDAMQAANPDGKMSTTGVSRFFNRLLN